MRAVALVLAMLLAGAGLARADAQADKAKAIALFDDGIKNLKAGNYEKACKSLKASNELMSDSGTRGSLAKCYTQLGKIASAWLLWRELTDTAPTAELRADAAQQAKKLDARLSKYVVKVKGAAPPGLKVTLDAAAIDPSIEVPTPIDAGRYKVEATATDHEPWRTDILVLEGKTTVIEVPALAPVARKQDPKPKVIVKKAGTGRRIAGIAIGTLGVGGLVVGGVFGAKARSLYADAKKLCGGSIDDCPMAQLMPAQSKVDKSRDAANISTIAFAAGGVAVVTGLILFVTAPTSETRTVTVLPTVDRDGGGLAVLGRF